MNGPPKSLTSSQRKTGSVSPQPASSGTIPLWGSVVLLFNNMAGPGMLALPVVFRQAGIAPSCLVLTLFACLSASSAAMLCESIAVVHRLKRAHPDLISLAFQDTQRFEFSNVVRFFYGDMWYSVCQIAYILSLQSLNMASIIVCAQGVDNLLIHMFGASYAMEFYPSIGVVSSDVSGEAAFGSGACVLTLGYLLLLFCFAPLGFLSLGDSTCFNGVCFVVTLTILAQFLHHFTARASSLAAPGGADAASIPILGADTTQLVGVMVFCYSSATLIPSWYNEKSPHVSGNTAIWTSTASMGIVYICIGVLGAWAYPHIASDNVLNIMSTTRSDALTRICVVLFLLFTIAPNISTRSITIRLNLSSLVHPSQSALSVPRDNHFPQNTTTTTTRTTPLAPASALTALDPNHRTVEAQRIRKLQRHERRQRLRRRAEVASMHGRSDHSSWYCAHGVGAACARNITCRPTWAVFWGGLFPWLVSFLFYEAKGFAHLINWTSLTVNANMCFVVPALVYLKARQAEALWLQRASSPSAVVRRENGSGERKNPVSKPHQKKLRRRPKHATRRPLLRSALLCRDGSHGYGSDASSEISHSTSSDDISDCTEVSGVSSDDMNPWDDAFALNEKQKRHNRIAHVDFDQNADNDEAVFQSLHAKNTNVCALVPITTPRSVASGETNHDVESGLIHPSNNAPPVQCRAFPAFDPASAWPDRLASAVVVVVTALMAAQIALNVYELYFVDAGFLSSAS